MKRSKWSYLLAWLGVIICGGLTLFCLFGAGVLIWAYFPMEVNHNNDALVAAWNYMLGAALGVMPTLSAFAWIFKWDGWGWDWTNEEGMN